MQLIDFVKVYPNAIPDHACDYFIHFYEQNREDAERYVGKGLKFQPTFNQLIFTDFYFGTPQWDNNEIFNNQVATLINSYGKHYVESLGLAETFPPNVVNEKLRVKKYILNGEDEFPLHVATYCSQSSVRCLSMLAYLNTVEEGGETLFPSLGLKIKPTKGTLMIFPPNWMFPHVGTMPVSEEKYLLSTYWHMTPFENMKLDKVGNPP